MNQAELKTKTEIIKLIIECYDFCRNVCSGSFDLSSAGFASVEEVCLWRIKLTTRNIETLIRAFEKANPDD